jgi:hypothetical protein
VRIEERSILPREKFVDRRAADTNAASSRDGSEKVIATVRGGKNSSVGASFTPVATTDIKEVTSAARAVAALVLLAEASVALHSTTNTAVACVIITSNTNITRTIPIIRLGPLLGSGRQHTAAATLGLC